MTDVENLAIARVLVRATLFSNQSSLVERHHALDALIASVTEYKAAFPLPVAPKGFGWRKPEEQMPEEDASLLLSSGGDYYRGRWQRNGTWLVVAHNTYETGRPPDAWTYIPDSP